MTGSELEPSFPDSKNGAPAITGLGISVQKGNRPGFVFFYKSELQYMNIRQHCMEITNKDQWGQVWLLCFDTGVSKIVVEFSKGSHSVSK